jgi:hypothetical protein
MGREAVLLTMERDKRVTIENNRARELQLRFATTNDMAVLERTYSVSDM